LLQIFQSVHLNHGCFNVFKTEYTLSKIVVNLEFNELFIDE
jgi:hypothetical protein